MSTLANKYGSVDGAADLDKHIAEAKAALTPDNEFFDDAELVEARDQAIEKNRAGWTEPYLIGSDRIAQRLRHIHG